jgi:hypothetical protein
MLVLQTVANYQNLPWDGFEQHHIHIDIKFEQHHIHIDIKFFIIQLMHTNYIKLLNY